MPPQDDFVHVFTHPGPTSPQAAWPGTSTVSEEFFGNTKGDRIFTEGLIVDKLRKDYPKHHLTVNNTFNCDILSWAKSRDDVSCTPHGDSAEGLAERSFVPPPRRYGDETGGAFADNVLFGVYDLVYNGNAFLIYIIEGSLGGPYTTRYNYVLVEDLTPGMVEKDSAREKTDALLKTAAKWLGELHNEVLVFDQGFWQKNKELYQNIQKSNWEDVILDEKKKQDLIDDAVGFFDAEKRYEQFGVPWKRGLIFYGPPGNGKTISTKALMHDVSKRTSPAIESLYVKTLSSYQGPEYSVRAIFQKARQLAPCLLIFEDIDSLINPGVRSYFLNEVDGLESNHGILMIGSTNHLERLDPGIAKRPSRFDRKYFFDMPSHEERIKYCDYWRKKPMEMAWNQFSLLGTVQFLCHVVSKKYTKNVSRLSKNKEIDFPKELSARVADITSDFSFAYLKEAFVAALLVIVRTEDKERYTEGMRMNDDLSKNVLWKELKKQIEALRKEMDGDDGDEESATGRLTTSMSGLWPALASMSDERSTRPMEIRGAMPRYF